MPGINSNTKKGPVKSKAGTALICFLLFIGAVPAAVSIGISSNPIPPLYFFRPGMEINMDMKCIEYTDDCEAYAEGSFSENVNFTPLVQTGVNEKSFSVTIKLPQETGAPGQHNLYIGVTDVKNAVSSGISVITKVRKVFRFMVLYDEKYADVVFSVPNINENDVAQFTFDVSNYGKPDLMLVYGNVDVFNDAGIKVGDARTKSTGIKSTESAQLTAEWDSKGAKSGEYTAAGKLNYDGNEKMMNQTFLIGIKDVAIINHTKDFEEGKIGRMDINVKNNWNGPIKELYAVVKVNDMGFKTPSASIMAAFQNTVLETYIDATNLKKGNYDAEITLYFDGMQKTEKTKINVFRPKSRGVYLPMQLGMNTTTVLGGAILLLLLLNILIILLMRRKGKQMPGVNLEKN